MDELAKQVGARMRKLRTDKGLTQLQVSDKLGVHPLYFSRWENGRNLPQSRSLMAIAKALGSTVHFLLTGQEPPESTEPYDWIKNSEKMS